MKNLAPRNDRNDIPRWGDIEDAIIGGEQTTKSTVDGGDNVFTFKDLKGQTHTLIVKNGSKGATGAKGDKGDKGDTGAAGLTTQVAVGGTTFSQSGGKITVSNAAVQKAVTPTAPASGQIAVFDGTAGQLKSSGYTIATSVPSEAKFTDTVYTHPTTAGNKHIPSGGASGNVLTWSAAGTAKWEAGYIIKSDANGYYIEV